MNSRVSTKGLPQPLGFRMGDDYMTTKDLFFDIIQRSNVTTRMVADICGVSTSTVGGWRCGNIKPTPAMRRMAMLIEGINHGEHGAKWL